VRRPPARNALVYRVVLVGWLVGWYWKGAFYVPFLFTQAFAQPLAFETLPAWLQAPWLAALVWALPALALPTLLVSRLPLMRGAAALLVVCSFVACVHLETFTDATFVVSFWVALWLLWFSFSAHRDDEDLALHGRVLALSVVGLVFLGGVLGKLTGEYTGGEAFHHLYFLQKDTWPYPWLRDAVSPEALRSIATWFSRAAIAGELLLAASPLLPHRLAVGLGCAVMGGMVVVSTLYLLSVMACLVGLLLASLWLSGQRR
jgi:hypothetical protein